MYVGVCTLQHPSCLGKPDNGRVMFMLIYASST